MRSTECSVHFSRTPPLPVSWEQCFKSRHWRLSEGGCEGKLRLTAQRTSRQSPVPRFSLKAKPPPPAPSQPVGLPLSPSPPDGPFLPQVAVEISLRLLGDCGHSATPAGTPAPWDEDWALGLLSAFLSLPVSSAVRLVRRICLGFHSRDRDDFSRHLAGGAWAPWTASWVFSASNRSGDPGPTYEQRRPLSDLRDEDNCLLSFVFNPGSQQDHCSHSALTHGIGFDKYLALKMKMKKRAVAGFPRTEQVCPRGCWSWMQRRLRSPLEMSPRFSANFPSPAVSQTSN